MKKCPFCAEEIQNEAVKCKHCGTDLIPQIKPSAPPPVNPTVVVKSKEGLFLKTLNGGCAIIFIFIALVIIIALASSHH